MKPPKSFLASDLPEFVRDKARDDAILYPAYVQGEWHYRTRLPNRPILLTIALTIGEVPPQEVVAGDTVIQERNRKATLFSLGAELVSAVPDGDCTLATYRLTTF